MKILMLYILFTVLSSSNYYTYYENAPYYNAATLSDEMLQQIERNSKSEEILSSSEEIKELEKETTEEPTKEVLQIETVQAAAKKVTGISIENPLTDVHDLSGEDNKIAHQILDAINDDKSEIVIEDITFKQLLNIAQAVQNTYFYAELDSYLSVADNTVFIGDSTKENLRKSNFVKEAVKKIGYPLLGLSEEEAINRLNDYIRYNITYEENTRDLYSLTYNHIGNCDSYSQLVEQVCDYLGIESKSIECTIKDVGPHMCNKVNINDKWYYIDVTLNQSYNNEYCLSESLWPDTHVYIKEFKREWTLEA